MKSRILAILVLTMLSLPVQVQAVDDISSEPVSAVQEQVQSQYKQPVSKRKIAKKFLFAMSGVAVSSFLIYFMLTLYNKVREGLKKQVKTPDGETSLVTPDDIDSAIKTFLDKTKWE